MAMKNQNTIAITPHDYNRYYKLKRHIYFIQNKIYMSLLNIRHEPY